jgi:hypothetical protein
MMSTREPTQEQQANLDRLYVQLKNAKSDLNYTKRGYRNATLTQDESMRDDFRQLHAEAAAEYNALVAQINELTAPFRAAAREQRNAAVRERRDAQQAQQRAQLRASTCTVCGLVHAGEC